MVLCIPCFMRAHAHTTQPKEWREQKLWIVQSHRILIRNFVCSAHFNRIQPTCNVIKKRNKSFGYRKNWNISLSLRSWSAGSLLHQCNQLIKFIASVCIGWMDSGWACTLVSGLTAHRRKKKWPNIVAGGHLIISAPALYIRFPAKIWSLVVPCFLLRTNIPRQF